MDHNGGVKELSRVLWEEKKKNPIPAQGYNPCVVSIRCRDLYFKVSCKNKKTSWFCLLFFKLY